MVANSLKPISQPLETIIKMPIVFSLVILYQGLFSGAAIEMPSNLQSALEQTHFRFISLFLVALGATQDIEYALMSVLIFLVMVYAIRTPEEREKNGLI